MAPPAVRPNVLVITTDQQRYDSLGVAGNPIVRTPHLDRLARTGVLFSRAYCQNPTCIPSRACLHTGRYPHQHGVQYMEDEIDTTPGLPPWETTVMERLQAAGYHTGACGKIHMMPPRGYHETALTGGKGARWTQALGLPIGPAPLGPVYAAWLERRHPGGYEAIYEQRRRPEYWEHRTAIVNVLPEEEYVETWIQEEAVSFLNRLRGDTRPFFLWVGFCGPHGPFDPPPRYAAMYAVEDMPLARSFRPERCEEPERETWLNRLITAHYYAMMTCIDDMIGRILGALEANGQRGHTVILVTSDHGELLGDHNRYGKSCFFEPVTRVPAILHHPELQQGFVFAGLIETFAVAATVLDLAGVPRPVEMTAPSLVPILRRDRAEGWPLALCEHVSNDRQWRAVCARTDRHKLALWHRTTGETAHELYDLAEDPLEQRNLYGDPARRAICEEMKDRLLARLLESGAPPYDSWLRTLPRKLREEE